MPSRRISEDSLHDPKYPDVGRGSSSRARRPSDRSSRSSRSVQSNLTEAEADEWKRSISDIHQRSDAGEDGFSPRAPTQPTVQNDVPLESSRELSRAPPPRPLMVSQPGGWDVMISPMTSTFAAPHQPRSPPRQQRQSYLQQQLQQPADADSDDDEHLPSFNQPSPAYQQPAEGSPRSGPTISPTRPTFHSTYSSAPLMQDTSAVNTPMSVVSDPFSERTIRPSHFTSQSPGRGPADARSDSIVTNPPRIHINSVPTSPATPSQATISTVPQPSTFSAIPAGDTYTAYTSRTPRSDQSPGNRRPSYAGTQQSVSGVSVTSALDSVGGKLTAAERRNLRMKQVIGKKGKKERDVKGPGGVQINRKPFQSTRLKEEIYKPWLEKKDPAQRWARWITLISILVGVAVMAVICWDGYNSVPRLGNICPVLTEDFSNGLNTNVWTREVRVDGYGHGQFDYSTGSTNNSFVADNTLYLVPTLTSDVLGEAAIQNGYTLNLTADGTCTSTNVSQCVAVSNTSQLTVINPVMSARLTTRMSMNIRYGKVEVVARFPTGDWLWPSISLHPVNETYGKGPRSGSVDIVTGRGNNASYTQRGVDYAQSTLHWGPTNELDRAYLTWGYREQRRSAYNQGFRTFGFEWNENYLWTYIDSRVAQVVSLKFDQSFWNRGKFPSTITNTTTGDVVRLTNPWINSMNNNAPFDQPFYLTLSLGVGATDGWFPDGEGGKPWLDNSLSAMSDFWNAKNRWWNAWPSDPKIRGFAIKSVKMWKTC